MSGIAFLDAAVRQAHALDQVGHRPWPAPEEPWLQAHTREDVLFAHWPVGVAELARLLPPALPLDTYDGDAWVGVVAFRLANVRFRGLPSLPRLTFPQVDVRTYVTFGERSGVWPLSVELGNLVLVEAAKRLHRLPAYRARVAAAPGRYEAERDGRSLAIRYRATGGRLEAERGSLEHWLTERYCLYTSDGGRLFRTELHHAPWRLRRAEAMLEDATLAPVALAGEPHVLCADAQDALVWPVEEL